MSRYAVIAGACLTLAVSACDHSDSVEAVVHSPDGELKAAYAYFYNGVLVGDYTSVLVYRMTNAGWGEPCLAFSGDYAEISALSFVTNDRLSFRYKQGSLANIPRVCRFEDANGIREVAISATEISREMGN